MRTPVEEREVHAGGYTYKNIGTDEKPVYVKNDEMEVYTSDYSYMLKFDRFCKDFPEDWREVSTMKQGDDIVGKSYVVKIECVLFRGRKPKVAPLSEEQRAAAAERLRKAREA